MSWSAVVRAVTAVLAGVALLVVAGGVALEATAEAQAAAEAPGRRGPRGRLRLVSQTPWVAPGGTFSLRIGIGEVHRPEATELWVSIHEAISSRSQFRQTLDDQRLGTVVWRRAPVALATIEPDEGGAIPVTVDLRGAGEPSDPDRPDLNRAAVHPVRVELRDASSGEAVEGFTTHLVRTRDDDAAALAVAWVQPFGAPPALRPDGTVAIDAAVGDDLAATAQLLGEHPAPLSLVPTPETLDALGATRPDLLDELRSSLDGRQVVAGPYVDIDTVALSDAGLGDEVAAQRERGAEVVASTLGVTPDGATLVGDADDVAPGALGGVERLVAPEEALVPLERSLTLANPFLVRTEDDRLVEAAAVDPGLAAHFTSGDDPVLAAHHLLADLAVVAYDSPGLARGVVVRPPQGWTPRVELLATALGALRTGPVMRPVTLDELFDEVPKAMANGTELVRSLRPAPDPSVDVPAMEARAVRGEVTSFATMTEVPAAVAPLERLVLVAGAEGLTGDERRAYLRGARRGIAERLDGIDILSSGSFRLTSREATIPVTLVNGLDAAMRVSLSLESDKLDFVDAEPGATGTATIPLVLQPGNTPVVVPVEARTSGEFPLLITLRSPDGNLDVSHARLTVRSTFLSGVGLALSAGAGVFLCAWWGRHWRTARRDRRLVEPPR
ncbi:MAG: hypothetical protein KY447_04850 [Actinobacteria bacterium]|nr:hypothetical protein [Actinomycetota bacterium]